MSLAKIGLNQENIYKEVEVTLKDLYLGLKDLIIRNIKRYTICMKCNGEQLFCEKCIKQNNSIFLSTKKCRHFKVCNVCLNEKYVINSFEKVINIEAGAHTNDKIMYKNEGNQKFRNSTGDLIFIIKCIDTCTYCRINNDLYLDIEVSPIEALKGFEKSLLLMDNSTILYSCKFFEKFFIFKNKGMPLKNSNDYGDLILQFKIEFNYKNNTELFSELEKNKICFL